MTKKEKKALDSRISAAYSRACEGWLVSVMDLGKIYAAGAVAVSRGVDDAGLELALQESAAKYRVHDKHA